VSGKKHAGLLNHQDDVIRYVDGVGYTGKAVEYVLMSYCTFDAVETFVEAWRVLELPPRRDTLARLARVPLNVKVSQARELAASLSKVSLEKATSAQQTKVVDFVFACMTAASKSTATGVGKLGTAADPVEAPASPAKRPKATAPATPEENSEIPTVAVQPPPRDPRRRRHRQMPRRRRAGGASIRRLNRGLTLPVRCFARRTSTGPWKSKLPVKITPARAEGLPTVDPGPQDHGAARSAPKPVDKRVEASTAPLKEL
jgi:hypothetical protein